MIAVQIIIAVIPIVGIVMGSTLVFFYLLWRHKQIIRQIESRTYIPAHINIGAFCLLLGILLSAIGVILTSLFYIIDGITYILLGGLIPFSLGISLLCFYAVAHKNKILFKPYKNLPPEV